MYHSCHYLPTDTKKKVESNEEESYTSTDNNLEDLEALEPKLFDFSKVLENRRPIILLVPLYPDRPYKTSGYPGIQQILSLIDTNHWWN